MNIANVEDLSSVIMQGLLERFCIDSNEVEDLPADECEILAAIQESILDYLTNTK